MTDDGSFSSDRRRLLLGLAATGSLAGRLVPAQAATPQAASPQTNVTAAPPSTETADRHPFYGRHQAGIVTPRPAAGLVAAFEVIASNPAELSSACSAPSPSAARS